uniref:FMRFamide-18 n=3 Tax=Oestroidea TaxID=43755 RepID=FAR18_SARBU|nr:RecName: Full=FMRFamide-18; AltName: Full=Neb-FIRFamide-1; AltName: Full=SabFMRFamide-18 [Sarcophaga bullata]
APPQPSDNFIRF